MRAHGGAHQQKGLLVEAGRGVLDRCWAHAAERHGIERIAADAGPVRDARLRSVDERYGRAAIVAARQHSQVLGVLGEGNGAQAAAQGTVAGKRQPIALARRPAGHGTLGRGDAGAGQQPAGEQRLGQRHGDSEAAGLAQHGEAVGRLGAGAA